MKSIPLAGAMSAVAATVASLALLPSAFAQDAAQSPATGTAYGLRPSVGISPFSLLTGIEARTDVFATNDISIGARARASLWSGPDGEDNLGSPQFERLYAIHADMHWFDEDDGDSWSVGPSIGYRLSRAKGKFDIEEEVGDTKTTRSVVVSSRKQGVQAQLRGAGRLVWSNGLFLRGGVGAGYWFHSGSTKGTSDLPRAEKRLVRIVDGLERSALEFETGVGYQF